MTSRERRWPGFGSSLGTVDLLAWYALSALVVHVVPSLWRHGGLPWTLPLVDQIQAWYWTSAFLLAAFGLLLWRALHGGLSILSLLALTVWPWPFTLAVLLLRESVAHSRLIALMSAVLGGLLLVIPFAIERLVSRLAFRAVSLGGLIAAIAIAMASREATRIEPTQTSSRHFSTAFAPIEIRHQRRVVPEPRVIGGAVARLGRGLLLVTGAGDLYHVVWDSTGQLLAPARLDLSPLMSRDGVEVEGHSSPLMRVSGLAVRERGDSTWVWAAHEVWDHAQGCLAVQVSAIGLYKMKAHGDWRRLYTTKPCVKPAEGFDPFDAGGRLTTLGEGTLLLTVGDYGMSLVPGEAASQQPGSDYGKTIVIRADGTGTVHTMGHRNPSGVTVDGEGNVWVTEHGPRGGDELNLLRPGANYGWPLTTYGTEYGSYHPTPGPPSTQGLTEPAMVFVPSVAISSVIAVRGQLFDQWRGSLLAGSLGGKQLLRFHRVGSRVVYAEPIPIGARIRDLVELEDGRIVLWTDVGDMMWLAPDSEIYAGTMAYQQCIRCHDAIEETDSHLAPSIGGVVGRRVASNPEFHYSEALKQLGGRWTEARLDSFVRSPATFAPGTKMAFPGLADSAMRKALIKYLRPS